MAIALDSANNGGYGAAGSATWAHTCTGTDLILFVGCATVDAGGDTVTGITYNGVAMTRVPTNGIANDGGDRRDYMYYLINPATGSNNVVITTTGTDIWGCSISYTGSHQTTPINGSAKQEGQASPITTSVTTTEDNCWSILWTGFNRQATASTGSTLRATNATVTSSRMFDSNGPKTPAGAQAMTTTIASDVGTQIQVAFAPSVAAGPSNLKTYNTNVKANIKTIDTNAIANVKTLNTNA